MLVEVKTYLKNKGDASLQELCKYFHVEDENTMREMLDIWIKKRVIRKKDMDTLHCKQCPQCKSLKEVYECIK